MFQFRRFPTYTYFIQYMLTVLLQPGCPIRKSSDITPAYGSPRLIAVNHVLLRLPAPRHSPCALCSLTSSYYAFSLSFRRFLPRPFSRCSSEQTLRKLCDSLKRLSYFFTLLKIVINYPFLKYYVFSRRST